MADTVMLGMLGEIQLSAASIANQLGFIFMLFGFGTGSGAVVLVSQFWGKKDVDSIHKTITVMYRIMIAASLVFTVLAVFFPRAVVSVFTTDELVILEAVTFLRIVGISYLFAGIASTTVTVLRAVRTVKISIVVYICSLVINIVLNWILIFGKLGAPALGAAGAAIATCIARFFEFAISMVFMFFFENKIKYKFKMLFARKLGILRNFMKNASPVVINELLWGTGMSVVAIVVGRMGREFVAANSICSVLSQLVTIIMAGIANGSAVIIGNTVGEGKYGRAKEYSYTILALSFLFGLISSGLVLLLKNPMISLYNISPLARTYANQIMIIFSVLVVFNSVNCTTLVGILRGGGDTRFVLVVDVVFMWIISIPLGFLTGLFLGWPVWAVYIVLKSDEVLKVIASVIRVLNGNWINDVTTK